MRTRLDTPGQGPTWRIRLDTGSHRLLHLARLVLDAKDAAQHSANRLRHVKRKGEPLGNAALAASGLPVAVDLFALVEGADPRTLERARMDEYVLRAVLGSDEVKAFGAVENLTVPVTLMMRTFPVV